MGRQFRYTSNLKRKAAYNRRRRERLNAVIKAVGGNTKPAAAAKPAK